MFYLKYRTSKPIIDLAILLFVGILLMTGCGQQSTSPADEPEVEEPTCEKDGIISLVLEEQVVDSIGHGQIQLIDTLFVSETEDSIWIRNAVQFSLPQSGSVTLFFKGILEDMPKYVAVWYTWIYKNGLGKMVLTSRLRLLKNNQGMTMLVNTNMEIGKQDSINGFAFFFDFDRVHAGSGQLSLESGSVKKTISLQSENHTALLNSNFKIFDFKVDINSNILDINCSDYDSFVNLKYDVIWLLQYQTQTDSFLTCASSRTGWDYNIEGTRRDFRIIAFAPNFIN